MIAMPSRGRTWLKEGASTAKHPSLLRLLAQPITEPVQPRHKDLLCACAHEALQLAWAMTNKSKAANLQPHHDQNTTSSYSTEDVLAAVPSNCMPIAASLLDCLKMYHQQAAYYDCGWTFQQDVCLLAQYVSRKPLDVPGRSAGAASRHLAHLRRELTPCSQLLLSRRAIFTNAVTSPAGPIQWISHDTWTRIDASCTLPSQAHVDWIRGNA